MTVLWEVPSIIILAWQMRKLKQREMLKVTCPRGLKASKCKSQISNLNILALEVVSFPLLHVNCSVVPDRESFINVSCRHCYVSTSLILTTSHTFMVTKRASMNTGDETATRFKACDLIYYFSAYFLCCAITVDLWESYKNSAEFRYTFHRASSNGNNLYKCNFQS